LEQSQPSNTKLAQRRTLLASEDMYIRGK